MNDFMTKGAATSSVLTQWAGEAAVLRRTAPPVQMFDGTGLPIVGRARVRGSAGLGGRAVAMAAPVPGRGGGRGGGGPGIPPRGRPVRC